ncbi:polyphosphate kinase 1 [Adhaeribacter soli]|uniref:Polyphosphate kinase n=1 Tax=Adhaeribacter soli TaxID=2607655 RepID=A0A5N1II99_9BACT|nr:polyphosphate kinase 1 [Adhaeribacter soli]KAA9324999.1 polyphosphate kinase 1 [Adhaeribacter soli]
MKNLSDPKIPLLSRDVSWLAFNFRVLQEASDPRVPLLERIKFMAIFSSNLDEFFKVRVATLRRLLNLKKKTRNQLYGHPSNELNLVLQEVARQQRIFGNLYYNQILPELQANNIFLLNERELSTEQQAFALEYFKERLQPLLRPVLFTDDPGRLFLKDQVVYLVVPLATPREKRTGANNYALLEIPSKKHAGRFVKLPSADDQHCVIFIDDIIRLGLPGLFPEYVPDEAHAIKISRDAELDLDEDVTANLLEKIKASIRKREKGRPARLLIDPGMPVALLELLQRKTGVKPEETITGSSYHNFRDFFSFPVSDLPQLSNPPLPPLSHPDFKEGETIFDSISRKEILLYYPYQKFSYVLQFLEEAAKDPAVSAINITLYRLASKSKVAKALMLAAKNGKLVTALVELKARFDEEMNVSWARKLENAGVNVIYGVPGHKVHCKLALVTRRENNLPVNYAYLSTGNFNEETALTYCDHGLFTKDERLTKEMELIFQYFMDLVPVRTFKYLLVAPFTLRKKLEEYVDNEIKQARKKKPAYILFKLNSLQDPRMVLKLYEASQAGVKIDLIVRGICTLVPGIKNLSENIRVRSIVDRFLEHSRVYVFGNGGKEMMYLASADLMTRNLSNRVEAAFPIYDPGVRQLIREQLNLQLQDTVKARRPDNTYYLPEKGRPALQSQPATYQQLQRIGGKP